MFLVFAQAFLGSLIADALAQDNALILATDPDREGEAISWHLEETLRKRKVLKKDTPVSRVVFNAITNMLRPMKDALSGLHHYELSINYGTGVQRMGTWIKVRFTERAKCVYGYPPRSAVPYFKQLFRLTLDRGSRLLESCNAGGS